MGTMRLQKLVFITLIAACRSREATPEPERSAPSPTPVRRATAVDAKPYPVRWSNQLALAALPDAAREFNKDDPDQFGALALAGAHETPRSCARWSEMHRAGYEPESNVAAQGDGYARIRCGTLALLQKVQPAKRSCLRELGLNEAMLARLPALIASAWSDEAMAAVTEATRHGRSLRGFDSAAHVVASKDESQLQIAEERGPRVSILIAPQVWGDFNGDDEDDLAVSVVNLSEGTASRSRLLLLTCSAPDSVLTVLPNE